ncbi:MAG: cysteine desulfurase family protein [Anaerolineales bacterium]|jgi:cysteine desulfurase
MNPERIYLDHAATTPVDPRVAAAMQPYFSEVFGNPSSAHYWGQQAENAVEESRRSVAQALNCAPDEVLFTGCGSESDNLALRGAALAQRRDRGADHILTSPVEHQAVLHTAHLLADHFDFDLELLPVDQYGLVSPRDLANRIKPHTAVVSVIYGNNEIGSINPIPELASVCHQRGVPFHTDAVQAASQLPLDVDQLQVDLMSIGAHKFYGPKGIGALYVRKGTNLIPTLSGGGQEYGLRAGTHSVPLIVGLAESLRITARQRESDNRHFQKLRNHIISSITKHIPNSHLTGHPTERLPNHASFVFEGVDANSMTASLDLEGYACASASACKTGDPTPSEVLASIGIPPPLALSALRVTVGRATTTKAVDAFLAVLPEVIARLRATSAGRT